MEYYKFIPQTESKNLPPFEQFYYYENGTSCHEKYALKYDLKETRILTDSIAYSYSNDTVLSHRYKQDEHKEWKYFDNSWKIIDTELGVKKKDYIDGYEKKYTFSTDHKILSIIIKNRFSSGESKVEFIYAGDLIFESKYYEYTPEDSLLISTQRFIILPKNRTAI